MAVDRFSVSAGAALVLLSACTGTIESPVPGGWDATETALDPSIPIRSANGTPAKPTGNTGSSAGNGKGSPNNPGAPGGSSNPGAPGGSTSCATPVVGESPLRRLTRTEYDNSVRDLLGTASTLGRGFVADTQVGLFDNTATTQTIPVLLAEQILDAAVELAEGVRDVRTLVGCDPAAANSATCVRTWVTKFGRRAYRRPLESAELTRIMTLYDTTRTASDAATGIRAVVAATLAAPAFIFRPEYGTGTVGASGGKPASQFELAGRLASLVWASVPDDVLLDAAAADKLMTKEQVQTQARRMLDDPRSQPAVAEFLKQWFGLDRIGTTSKDNGTYPDFSDEVRAAMAEESRLFIDDVVWKGDATISSLLTSSYSFVNEPLAKLYGVTGVSGDAFTRVELNPDQRAGVLTQGSVLAAYARPDQSSPVKRGQWVRVRLLCQDLPDPPANVPELPAPQEGVSNRERFAMHTNNPACSGCHNLIDGLGFGLEQYDGIGRFRTKDQGVDVDSSGEITATVDIDGKYEGGTQLADLLAGSEQVRDCAPTQWLRYSLGRRDEADDACSLSQVQAAFEQANGDLKELVIALTQTDAFWQYRRPE